MVSNNVSCIILFMVLWQPGMIDRSLKRLSGNWQGKFTLGQEHSVINTENIIHIDRNIKTHCCFKKTTSSWGGNINMNVRQS